MALDLFSHRSHITKVKHLKVKSPDSVPYVLSPSTIKCITFTDMGIIYRQCTHCGNRDISLSIETGWTTEKSGFDPRQAQDIHLFSTTPRPVLRAQPNLLWNGCRVRPLKVVRPGREHEIRHVPECGNQVQYWSPKSSCNTVTRPRAARPATRTSFPSSRNRFFSSPQHSDRIWGPASLLANKYEGSLTAGKVTTPWSCPHTSI
jgi:hypothetical protein